MSAIRVVLVDDHSVVRAGLARYLGAFEDLEVVAEVPNAEALLQGLADWLPDVVVMDLLMPGGMDGVEATRRVRRISPRTQIVVLTAQADEAPLFGALRAGAIGYVRKDAEPEVLVQAVRAAARGQTLLDPGVAGAVLGEIVRGAGPTEALTEREIEVLRQLATGRTNREIGKAIHVSEETVKTHVGNILAKLHLRHRTQAVVYGLKRGWIALDELDPDPS